MNIGKRILRIVLSTVAMLGCLAIAVTISGCGLENVLPESEKDKALEYLNTKYSAYEDTFTPVSYIPSDWSDSDSTVTFKSQKYDDQIVTVFIHSDHTFCDDYYKLYMADEAEQFFISCAKEHGIAANVHIKFMGIPDKEYDENQTFEEYIDEGLGHMNCYYVVSEQVKAFQAKALIEDVRKKGIYGNVHIYMCNNEEDVQKIIENDDFSSEKLKRLYKGRIQSDGTVTIE